MWYRLRKASVLLAALTVATLLGPVPAAHASTVPAGMVDPDNVFVDGFAGWGTALSWGANVVGGWSDPKRTAIADLLFSPTAGLGLNVVRYHIGAGQAADWRTRGCGQHRPGSPVPTHHPAAGTWDWAADANQRWLARAAQSRGADQFVAFASSPPAWMTINGCTNGGDGGGQNLKGWWGYHGNGAGAHNGTTSYSNNTGDSVTVRFSGTQIAFYAARSSDSGRAALSVDGGAESVVDLYATTFQGNQLVYTSPVLPSGTHTLRVRVTGGRNQAATDQFVSPDRVVVLPGGVSIDDQVRGTGLHQFDYHWNMYEPFADYLTEVTKHFRDSWGITFDLLDPLNEPENGWHKAGNQEGSHFDAASQSELINRVGQSLAAKGLNGLNGTGIAAPDGLSVASTHQSFTGYPASTKDHISTVNTHSYGTSENDQVALRNAAALHGKKLWMTEYGTGNAGSGGTDPVSARPAVDLAARIVGDLSYLRPRVWVLWDGIESWEQNLKENVGWGLIWGKYLDPGEQYLVAKQYYGYGNFTRFIRPGHRIIESGDSRTLAAYDPAARRLILVSYNDTAAARSVTFDVGRFRGVTSAQPYRTSDTESLARLAAIPVSGNRLPVSLPANSVTTLVLDSAIASPNLATVNDRDTGTGRHQFDFIGPWSHGAQPGAYLDDNSWSGSTDAYYQVRFHGTRVDLYGSKAANHGIAAVSVDGGPESNVDFYATQRVDNLRVYSSPTLPLGEHVLKVRVTGARNANSAGPYVPADRVDVTQAPRSFTVNDGQFEYVGTWDYYNAQPGAYLNDNHWSGGVSDYYRVRFKGTRVDLFGSKAANHGIAGVSVDGGPESNVDFYAPQRVDNVRVYSSPTLPDGDHILKVRVTGLKNAASAGLYVPADRVDIAIAPINDTRFQYAGGWSYSAQADAYGYDNHWSGAAGDHYQLTFTGTRVNLYGAKAPNLGIGAVSIDGGPESMVDFHGYTRTDNVLAWSSPVLPQGTHILKVRVTGAMNPASTGPYIPADRVDVFS